MIPIEIKDKSKFDEVGDNIVDILCDYINSIATLGYYTIKKKVNKKFQDIRCNVNPKTVDLCRRLNKKTTIRNLVFVSPCRLKTTVSWVNGKFTDDVVKKDIHNLFVDIVYSKILDKQALIDAIGLRSCPYCNRSYIYTITEGKVNPQLDHFYPKSKYPLFAVSLYNLIPSCAICNSAGAKGDKDTLLDIKYQIISPYMIKHEDFHFKFSLISPGIIKGKNIDGAVKLFFDHCACHANDTVFHLSALYCKHNDHVADLIYKRKYVYTDDYLESLYKIIGSKIDKSTINRFIVGAYVEKENYHKRPLSKMYAEIAKEVGLIDKK